MQSKIIFDERNWGKNLSVNKHSNLFRNADDECCEIQNIVFSDRALNGTTSFFWFCRNSLRTGIGRTPCPLEVVAAKPAGNVQHFPDKLQALYFITFHGFGRNFMGIHAAHGHFSSAIALRAIRHKLPVVD